MNTTPYEKLKTTLKNKLMGLGMVDPRYYTCVKALEFAEKIHDGYRKDGVTKEFYHQLSMLGFAMSNHNSLTKPYRVYTCIILHDTYEDFDKFKDKHPNLIEDLYFEFPDDIEFVVRISKIRYKKDGESYIKYGVNYDEYFGEMSECEVTSFSKGVDRFHNLSTMVGVFPKKKMEKYISEVDFYFLPMLKNARKKFPEQDQAYQMIKSVLNVQCTTVTKMLEIIE